MFDHTSNSPVSQSYVYIVQEVKSGYIKIGISERPFNRLGNLQTSNPNLLVLRYIFRCRINQAPRLEKLLHDKFKSGAVRAEWFFVAPERVAQSIYSDFELAACVSEIIEFPRYTVLKARRKITLPGCFTILGFVMLALVFYCIYGILVAPADTIQLTIYGFICLFGSVFAFYMQPKSDRLKALSEHAKTSPHRKNGQ